MAQLAMGGPGAASTIDINPDEMTHIANELLAIANEFEGTIKPAIKELKANKYLTKGKAKSAMEKVPKANERVMELQDQYNMASSVVFDILQTMIDADRDIAEKIIAALDI
ncbi:hypothetical protein [Listeria ivanovii]|uniref:hypothetical protein n=1 Tax=Listeria ivanovii TaxID=1638 RepID=UPI0005128644|nr:hypothetical protein [Listeria ivanovii]AIS61318.1 hypothetical protein JL53_00505 [Listeria ivanovii subsp. londoniensis]MBK1966157.1 hypothetical protein [Listeria ivanovii subsp. londoniensis]MBK1983797.1 hypothetical protein [Listeria ivanovii subsp. londoniensis]MBK1995873.1 hypothetical protein [Listeria ivanovii subsp. londoniensis]MBK2003238.1 hypothetical protein [Listeria ivanovii subsp. londoniensis]